MGETIDPLALDLWSRTNSNFNLLVRASRDNLAPLGISGPQYGVLRILHRRGARTMGEISQGLHVTAGNVTGLVDRLVHEGLVSRVVGKQDRRVVRTRLTSAGLELVEKAIRKDHRLMTELFSGFSEQEKETMLILSDRLEQALIRPRES